MPSERVAVKVCGLTVPREAAACVAAGAWAVGVVFARDSVRHVDLDTARRVLAAVPDGVARVGVFVEPSERELVDAAACGLTHVQLHGGAADVAVARDCTGLPVILGIPFTGPDAAGAADGCGADLVLFDAAVPGRHGGTGTTLDWEALAGHRPQRPFGLAGGLSPGNVARAVGTVQPSFVDVSSGVESAPGRKDPDLVRAFIEAAHA